MANPATSGAASNAGIMAAATAAGTAGDPSKGNNPALPSARYMVMSTRWNVITALLGGTIAMRAEGQTYLPKEPAEQDDAYTARLSRTTLFNGLKRSVLNLTARVFAKPITVGEDMPAQLDYLAEDMDRLGNGLNVFARKVFEDGVAYGLSHVLVDMPTALQPGATLADERAAKQEPYFVHVPANKLIGWRHEIINGQWVLMQARIMECIERPLGNFGTTVVERVRVLEPGKWDVYEQNEKKEWVLVESGTTTLNKVPLVTYYTAHEGVMHARPPLEDLAHINVQHWQSASDQRHILHVARVPLLFGAGLSTVGTEGEITVGPDNLIKGPIGSDLKYVEHSGAAITSGKEDVQQLEDKMSIMGLEPVMPRSGAGAPTATGRVIDSVENASLLQMWSIGLGDTLEQAYELAAEWKGMGDDAAGSLQPNTDLSFSLRDAQDLQTLYQSRVNGEITRETYWKELRRRNVLSDTFDPEKETAALEEEASANMDAMAKEMELAAKHKPPPAAPGTNLGGGA